MRRYAVNNEAIEGHGRCLRAKNWWRGMAVYHRFRGVPYLIVASLVWFHLAKASKRYYYLWIGNRVGTVTAWKSRGKCWRATVATGKGMKGLRGYVKPQESPFAPGYTDVHPPVHLVRIVGCQRGSWRMDSPVRTSYGYVPPIYQAR